MFNFNIRIDLRILFLFFSERKVIILSLIILTLKPVYWYLWTRHHLLHFIDVHRKGEVICLKLNSKSVSYTRIRILSPFYLVGDLTFELILSNNKPTILIMSKCFSLLLSVLIDRAYKFLSTSIGFHLKYRLMWQQVIIIGKMTAGRST